MASNNKNAKGELDRFHEYDHEVEALKQTDFFFNVFTISPASIAIARLDNRRFVAVNDGFTALFGYEAEEVIGRKAEEIELDVDPERRIDVYERVRSGELIRREETSIRTKDGKIRRVLGSFFPVEARGTRYMVSKLVDVTQIYELREKVLDVGRRERRRIGQDLHDGVSSQLTGIHMMLDSMINNMERDGSIDIEQLREIRSLVKESAEDTRRLSHGLSPIRLSKGTLVEALQELADNTDKLSGISCTYSGSVSIPELSRDTAMHLYWIVQEAVDNSRQHAGADRIEIHLQVTDDNKLMLRVHDDGKGFSATAPKDGMGLETIKYRSDIIGARTEIDSAPGEGTSLRCVLPLDVKSSG